MTDLNTFIETLKAQAAKNISRGAGGIFNDRLYVGVDLVQKRGSTRRDHFRVEFRLDGKRASRAAVDAAL